MNEGRDARRATLAAVVEIIKRERDVWPAPSELVGECEDALERTLFDQEAALAVLRGEQELDDDPWARCPSCDCDTYYRLRFDLEQTNREAPVLLFVCEACQEIQLRGRATVETGPWWTAGTRFRARPAIVGHPYRGPEVVEENDDDDDDDEVDEVDEVEAAATVPPDWSERKICPDGACIGIIGAEGACNVCGRTAEPA